MKSELTHHPQNQVIRLLTLGNSSVGKSSILVRYTEDKFFSSYLTTIGVDFIRKVVTINDKTVSLQIWDTAGQEKYYSISKQYYTKADGIILVFDLSKKETFEGMKNWLKEIKISSNKNTPIVLLGNKSDLCTTDISGNEIEKFAKEKDLQYFATSALTGENVNEAITELIKKAIVFVEKREGMKGGVTLSNKKKSKGCCG